MTFVGLTLAAIPISYVVYQLGRHFQEVNRIYDDFADDIERLENEIKAQNDPEKLQIFQEEKRKAIERNPQLQKAMERIN